MKERFKSPVVWTTILINIVAIVAVVAPSATDSVKIVGASVIAIASAVGILNNPTDKDNF